MDSKNHPVVQHGIKAAELISDVRIVFKPREIVFFYGSTEKKILTSEKIKVNRT